LLLSGKVEWIKEHFLTLFYFILYLFHEEMILEILSYIEALSMHDVQRES
jgi:hypothetical protein